MTHIEIFGYLLISVAVIAFLAIIFRSKSEIDYLQEIDKKTGKKSNSIMRLMFVVMIGYALFYITYQVMHKLAVDIVLVVTLVGIATGGKVGQKAMEGKEPTNPPETPAI